MPPPSAFGAQVAAIMDVLAKAAVAEITKLAEEGCVVLRLEVRRRDHEIQELRRSLEVTEAKLSKAQEALASRATEERQTQTSCRNRTVAPAECMQSVSQLVELPAALPPAQRPIFRSKGRISVWKPNQKLYTCSVCNRGFPRLSQLEEHKSTHQTLKPFRCLECGKSFTQKTRLKTHQSVHTGEKPFSCKICGKMFSRHDNCLRHERFHSGLKPHSCRQCGKSFTVLGNLKMHQEIHLQGR